ncbi:MAG: NAD(P)H-hydrate dehydratase [Pseudomonadota bacterium]
MAPAEALPQTLYTAEQSRELDAIATRDGNPDGYTLMCRAGQASLDRLQSLWPGASVSIVCGAGNNAGDGYVIGRLARQAGLNVSLYALVNAESLRGDAARACADFVAAGGIIESGIHASLTGAVIVDALLGTGITRPVGGEFAGAVEKINDAEGQVLAIDVPSGLCADTGSILGQAVKADVTLTFIGVKQGLLTGAGPEQCGKLLFDDLAVEPSVYAQVPPAATRLDERLIQTSLPPRAADSHKGSFGRLLLVGGNQGMPGALRLAGAAALRSGAGVVQLATHPSYSQAVAESRPELMIRSVADADQLAPLLDQADVVAVGPGLGTDAWAQEIWHACANFDGPMVVDADALNLLAAEPFQRHNWVLTPHPGELARLLRVSSAEVQANRFAAVRRARSELGGVALVKGAGTIIDDGQNLKVCSLGNPGMATAGMGDVLTGVIASLLCQGFTPAEGAALGVTVHAAAGDLAAEGGQRGLLAGDVVDQLRRVVNPCS